MSAAGLALAGLLISGCSSADLPRFGWPEGVTPQGRAMQHFWSATFMVALVVGVLVWGLMFWTFAFHRKKKNSPLYPKQTKENLPLELVYSVVPFIMVLVLFYFTITTQNYVLKKVDNPDVKISVTAFRWGWDFGYQGTNAADGKEVHTIETPSEVPILVLPVNKVIQYELSSRDVLHSFWTPDFLFKRDVFPYPKANNTENVIQNTIDRTGAFVGRCAELCGTYHSAMNFEIRAVPQDVYAAYLKLRVSLDKATGAPYTAAAALAQLQNTDMPSCGVLCSPTSTSTYPIAPNREAKSASTPDTGGG